jgi:cellulose synthase/poly-beta-1,6-N-acetylglucosamine synthase-like glycosyltransferase
MTGLDQALLAAYFTVVGALAIYGSHRYQMVWLYFRNRGRPQEPPRRFAEDELPVVTVQLPVYNEMYVVERLIDAVGRFDYPRDRLEVQVLDDSTDETTALCRKKIEEWRARGLDISLVRRNDRRGFKAGALAHGLERARGELIAIFDADFAPEPDVLRRTVDHFTDPQVGLVQTRWGHLNAGYSLLTEVQGIQLDGHLQIEQTARNRSGRFFNFNGTGGVWRRAAIVEAGGWHHDTLTEDLDISFRAQLRGWRFVFLPDVVSPAELPADMNAYKSQQHRWTKGAVQCARKLLPSVWRAELPFKVKVEATFQLTMTAAYVLMVLLCLLMGPAVRVRFHRGWVGYALIDIPFFVAATTSVFTFYIYSQREIYPREWIRRLRFVPLVISLGIGMCLANAKAVIEGLFGAPGEFVRTPKHGIEGRRGTWANKRYRAMQGALPFLELAFGVYFIVVFWSAAANGRWLSVPFLGLFLFGFFYVALLSLAHGRGGRRGSAAPLEATEAGRGEELVAETIGGRPDF